MGGDPYMDQGIEPIFKTINKAILTDDARSLTELMPIIRCICKYCVRRGGVYNRDFNLNTIRVWRASTLTDAQAQKFVPTRTYRPAMFVSTSTSLAYAEGSRGRYIWEIEI